MTKGTNIMIIKNAELWWARLNPSKPNDTFDKDQPTWEIQIRTHDKATAQEWKDANLNVKKDEDKDGNTFFKCTVKKKSKKRDGTPVDPVKVVNGQLKEIDPDTIGHGSIGNVRVYQYDYDVGGRQGVASMLMAVQITTHKLYEAAPRDDDFELTETEVVTASDSFGDNNVDEDDLF
jgi:hypothetical protein